VRFAAAHRLTFTITSIGARTGTEVGPFPDRLDPARSQEPLRVILLGCGTVGGGVYQRLAALPELFTVVGVGARTASRATEAGVPDHLFTSDLETLIEKPCDVVVELIGDTKRAAFLIERALHLGRNLVTANKTLIAHAGDELHTLAAETGATLCYSSAVGGVLPALETIKRVREVSPLRAISGVLNGTTNFILDQLAIGQSFGVAVKAAQERGYAEQDPQFDLDGIDAAQKLIILVAAAFDQHLALHAITRNGIRDLNAEALKAAQERGQAIRLVARCVRSDHGLEASVQPVELPLNHPFAQIKGAQNCLLVEPEVGERVVVSGEGAGRWPTTESVIADLFEIRSNHQEEEMKELEECVA